MLHDPTQGETFDPYHEAQLNVDAAFGEHQNQLEHEAHLDNELFKESLIAIRWIMDNMAIVNYDLTAHLLKLIMPIKSKLEERLNIIPLDNSAENCELPF